MRRLSILSCLLILITPSALAEDNPFGSVLAHHKIAETPAGVRAWLASMDQDDAARAAYQAHVRTLIASLADPKFVVRARAMRTLGGLTRTPIAALQEAARSSDLEVAWRAREALAMAARRPPRQRLDGVLHAVLRTVAIRKIKGCLPALLQARKHAESSTLQHALRGALAATSGPDDVKTLTGLLASEDVVLRLAGIDALVAVGGDAALPAITPLASDKDRRVALCAAEAMAQAGDRGALAPLLQLLGAPELGLRARACRLLRGLTGQQHGFLAYQSDAKRAAAVAKWAAWIAGPGRTAALNHPLESVTVSLGRVLVAQYSPGRLVEYDASLTAIRWQVELRSAYGVDGLPNGNRLACDTNGNLREWDASGKLVWQPKRTFGGTFGVQRLEDGTTLVASSNRVLAVGRDGNIVWQFRAPGRLMYARMLETGRILVCSWPRRVAEYDRQGTLHWQATVKGNPMHAQRLENGHTLLALYSGARVIEIDRDGKVTWSFKGRGIIASAQRLEDGTTLICESSRLMIVDASGKILREVANKSEGKAVRY